MTTPVSGAISFLDLANEYQGPYGFQRYALSMADLYNSANLVKGTIAVTTSVSIGGGNIITWSERFNIAPWTAFNASVSADQIVAPDGNTTAEKILVTGLGGGSYIQQNDVVTLKPQVQYTHSVYLRGDGSSVGRLCAIGNFNNGARVGQTSLTLTADWQRLSATFTSTATVQRNIFIQPNGVAGSNVAVGEAVFAWGYQITTGSTLQAYVQTTDQIVPEQFAINNTGAFVTTSVAARGAISMSQFYGVSAVNRRTLTITIGTNTSNFDVYTNTIATGSYSTGLTDVIVVNNATVNSASTPTYAMLVPSSFSSGDTVQIINNSFIHGRGGNGGASNPAGAGSPGAPGGLGIYVNRPVTIVNNGTIAAGGGGGGGGGRGTSLSGKTGVATAGGGGGGGAGVSTGGAPNGSPSTGTAPGPGGGGAGGNVIAAGPGGPGGALGAAGTPGTATPAGGGGGGAGTNNYITGNPFVTWAVTGTRSGGVG
jgi:hypothetical protein